MRTKSAVVSLMWLTILSAPVHAEGMSVQITGAEVEHFCYFDGNAYSPGASICDPLYPGRVLTCQPKSNRLPVPPGSPANTATVVSPVAGWNGAEDSKCSQK